MGTPTLVSVEEYLRTSYETDCDYVDGEVQERHVGERDHSWTQMHILMHFGMRAQEWGIYVYPEQRVQVRPTRFRIPDVCVLVGEDIKEPIFRRPPFLCIEILSSEDRMSRMLERVEDYLQFGVGYVWVIDPATSKAFSYSRTGVQDATDGVLRTDNPCLELPVADLFSGLRG